MLLPFADENIQENNLMFIKITMIAMIMMIIKITMIMMIMGRIMVELFECYF